MMVLLVIMMMVLLVKRVWKIDDSLDVFPVHGVGGIIGTLMAGVFASDQLGIFSGQGLAEGVTMADQVWVQFIGVVATAVYTALATWLILKVVAMMTDGLRVTLDEETEGLDIASHEERGYDL